MQTPHHCTEHCDELSDAFVLLQAQQEPELFVHIVRRYEAAFLRKARTVLQSEEDVEDVVQETFTKMYLKADRYHAVEGATVRSWGYAILMNTAFTRYQKRKREYGMMVTLEPEHYEALPDTVHEESFHLELSDYVVSILARMPDHLARVLERHFIRDVPQADIARDEGVTVGAIKTRVHRAKAEFRVLAEEYAPFRV